MRSQPRARSFRQDGPPRPDTRLEALRAPLSGLDAGGHRSTRPPPRRPRPLVARDIRGMENGARTATSKKLLQIETGATGLEPATSGVTGRRSNQLNYAPAREALYRRLRSSMGGDGIEPPTSCS